MLCIDIANAADRDRISTLRHEVYARELGQHPANDDGRLSDPLDECNIYIAARYGGELIGFVSVTPPHADAQFSIDKYVRREALPIRLNDTVYEVRLLTVAEPFRGTKAAPLLMYAALRWIEARGGRHVIAIGRHEVLDLYRKVGLEPSGITVRSGAVTFEVMTADVTQVTRQLARGSALLDRLLRGVDWRLDAPMRPTANCYHGGAFFDAIGPRFDTLERRHEIINADVLDAWFDPSPNVLGALRAHLPWLMRTSPPTQCEGMVQAIAEARGVAPDNILPGAGSSNLIFLALRQWLSRKSRTLILDPMYGEYAHVLEQVVGCRVDRFPLHRDEGYVVDPDRLALQLRNGYDQVVLVNPNSPTGRHVPRDVMQRVIADAPRRTRFWIDETYVEYLGADQSLEHFAAARDNVVVCKSMSKVYALSGVRAAYLCGRPALVEPLRALNPPWAVSLPAQVAAVAALQDPTYYRLRYKQTHWLRDRLGETLARDCGLAVLPAVANFVLCHLPDDGPIARDVVEACRDQGLFIRDASNMGQTMDDHTIRIAVKDEATNGRMVQIIRRAITSLRSKTPSAPRCTESELQIL